MFEVFRSLSGLSVFCLFAAVFLFCCFFGLVVVFFVCLILFHFMGYHYELRLSSQKNIDFSQLLTIILKTCVVSVISGNCCPKNLRADL